LWLSPLRHKTAEAVATALYEDVIVRTSVPSTILSDLGDELTGEVMQRLYERLNITRLRTSGYHPQTDAKCERVHYYIRNMITKLIGDKHDRWPDLLGPVTLAYNSTVYTSTRYTLHELFYSFKLSCALDAVIDVTEEQPTSSADIYALQATEKLPEAFQFMRAHTRKQTDRMKSSYGAFIKAKVFEEPSFVLLYSPKKKSGVFSKWQVTWIGQYRVMRKLNSTNYVIQKSTGSKPFVVHGDRLKDYHGDIDLGKWPAKRTAPSPADETVTSNPDRHSPDWHQRSMQHGDLGETEAGPDLSGHIQNEGRLADHFPAGPSAAQQSQ